MTNCKNTKKASSTFSRVLELLDELQKKEKKNGNYSRTRDNVRNARPRVRLSSSSDCGIKK
jgi:hypothetical protein